LQALSQEFFITRCPTFYNIFERLLTSDMAYITVYIKLRGTLTYTVI